MARFFILFFMLFFGTLTAQQIDSDGHEVFEFYDQEKDTTYIMKKYYMAFLYKGDNRAEMSPEDVSKFKKHISNTSGCWQKKALPLYLAPWGMTET